MNFTGILIALAFIAAGVLKIVIPYYNKWVLDGRPFNWQYIRPVLIVILTACPLILADFLLWTPPPDQGTLLIIILAALAGWGDSDAMKCVLEYFGLIQKVLNKIGKY